MLKLAATVLLAWLAMSSLALAAGIVQAQCGLSSDKSSMIVTASNPESKPYECTAFCKAHITGARPFELLNCTFNIAKGAKARIVCTKKGGKPNYYSEVMPTRSTCVPR